MIAVLSTGDPHTLYIIETSLIPGSTPSLEKATLATGAQKELQLRLHLASRRIARGLQR